MGGWFKTTKQENIRIDHCLSLMHKCSFRHSLQHHFVHCRWFLSWVYRFLGSSEQCSGFWALYRTKKFFVKLEMFHLWQSPFLVITGIFVFKSIQQIHLIKHPYKTCFFHDSGSFRCYGYYFSSVWFPAHSTGLSNLKKQDSIINLSSYSTQWPHF